ncbi:MAG: hypothetical protein ACE5GE_03515 [Phycisphaerae bacterium]
MNESIKKYGLMAAAAVLVIFAARAVFSGSGPEVDLKEANTLTCIDGKTEKVYQIPMEEDMPGFPLKNPDTGEETLWPAEMCFWNECGPAGGTPVLLNTYRLRTEGKDPNKAKPTECPKCGHITTGHNPRPPAEESPPQ